MLRCSNGAPFQELHLSHNEISHRGVCTLLAVLAMHPREVYPRQVEHLDEAVAIGAMGPMGEMLEYNGNPWDRNG